MTRNKARFHEEKLNQELKLKDKLFLKADQPVIAFLGFLSMLTFYITPWIIPPDGSLYLSSARSIFTADMFAHYHWMREPLYPTFLKVLLFNNNLFFVMFVQSLLVGCSIFLVYKSFGIFLEFKNWQKFLSTGVSFLFVRGFATEILMQAMLLFIVAAATYTNARIAFYQKTKRPISNQIMIGGSILCLIAFSLQILVGISALSVFCFMLIRSNWSTRKQRSLAIIGTLIICAIGLGAWQTLKSKALENGDLVFGSNSLSNYQFFESEDPQKRQEQRIQALTGTLGLAPERDAFISRPVGVALREWAMPFFNNQPWNQGGQCGQYDSSHSESILKYTAPLTEVKYCHADWQITLSNFLSAVGMMVYPIFSLLIIAFLVLLVLSLDLALSSLLGVSAVMLLQYALVGQGHSRFGAPLFMLAPFLLVLLLSRKKKVLVGLWDE
jgi:hypothetical protein